MKDYDKWGFGFIWVVVEMISFALGTWLGQQLYALLDPIPTPNGYLDSALIRNPFLLYLLVGLGIGLCTGIIEWLILRSYLKISSRWIVVSIISWAIAIPLGNFIYTSTRSDFGFAGLAIGFIVGMAQWSILRRTCPKAMWWIVARAAGGAFYFIASGFSMALASGIAAIFFVNSSVNVNRTTESIGREVQP